MKNLHGGWQDVLPSQQKAKWDADIERRLYAEMCLDVYHNNCRDILSRAVDSLLTREDERRELKKYLEHENLTERIVNQTCLKFADRTVVTVKYDGVADEQLAAWQEQLDRLLDESGFYLTLYELEKLVTVVHDVACLPQPAGNRLRLDIITPDCAFVHQEDTDPARARRFFYQVDVQEDSPMFNRLDSYHFWGRWPDDGPVGKYRCLVNALGQPEAVEELTDAPRYFNLPSGLPVVMFRLYLPLNTFWYPGRSYLVDKNIALDLSLTDLRKALSYNIPQLFTRGFPDDKPLIKSRSTHINLPLNEMSQAQPDASYLHPNEHLEEMFKIIRRQSQDLAGSHGVSEGALNGQTYSSGYHLALSMWETLRRNQTQRLYFIRPIKELLAVMCQTATRCLDGYDFPDDLRFALDLAEITFPESRLEKARADALEKQNLTLDNPRILMRDNPDLNLTEARAQAAALAAEA